VKKGSSNMHRRKVQNFPAQSVELVEQAEAYLKKNGVMSVPSLYEVLKLRNPSLTEEQLPDLVSRLAERGNVDVDDDPPATKSLAAYLTVWERNLSLYVPLAVSLSTVLVVYAVPADSLLAVLRWVLGSVYLLFIPGYVAVEALFPKGRELDGIERFAFSIGLSLALVFLVGLLFNNTPWGIRLTPIVISLTTLTIALEIVAVGRRIPRSVE
jgi:hypothetical protein